MKTQTKKIQVIVNQGTVLVFGKHKGRTVREVIRDDPAYVIWLHENRVVDIPQDIVDLACDKEADTWMNGPNHNYSSYYDE